jgi:hypothetical protein
MPLKAETTTASLSSLLLFVTMAIVFEIFSELATEVPPNFNTIIRSIFYGNLRLLFFFFRYERTGHRII